MAVVTLDGLTKIYERGHAPAADAVSLEIRHGEFMVLLGPSGCGKTTTSRTIAGLGSLWSGRLGCGGAGARANHAGVCMLFNSVPPYRHMSTRHPPQWARRGRPGPRDEIEHR